MIKAIIFDCWDTLFTSKAKGRHPFSIFAEKIGKNFHDYKFLESFERHFMLEKHYKLKNSIIELLTELNINFSKELINELEEILEKGLNSQKPFSETLEILKKLRKNYKLGLITNTFYQSFEKLEEKFEINNIFDIVLKSYETKILKPKPEVFKLMIKKLNLSPKDCIFVDDFHMNLKPAKKLGMKTILFKNNKQLIKDLKEFGIKV